MELFKMCVQSKCKATFLVYSSLIITERPKLSTTKIVYSKQRGGCFSVYSSLMSIAQLNVLLKKWLFKESGSLLFILFIINQYCTPKMCYCEFNKTFMKEYFLNCCLCSKLCKAPTNNCFLVFSSNFIKHL